MAQKTQGLFVVSLKTAGPCLSPITLDQQKALLHGNALLSDVGATARLDGALLRDERNYYRSPALPVAQPVEEHPYTSGATDLTLNYGTAVTPNDATTLVRTSEFAYLDTDRSGSLSMMMRICLAIRL